MSDKGNGSPALPEHDTHDTEILAITAILGALKGLQSGAQVRVLNYVIRRTLPNYFDLSARA